MKTRSRVTPAAKEVSKAVLFPDGPALPLWAVVYMGLYALYSRIVMTEMLPESVRVQVGMKSTKWSRGVYSVMVGLTRIVWPSQPVFLKHGMKNYYMWDMKRRIKAGNKW